MNVEQSMCAASGPAERWEQVDWSRCEQKVRRLQARIIKATQEGRHNKVKALQWLLTHSFCGRALAVKRVTHNKGKNTPGVDGAVWRSPASRYKAIDTLRRRGYPYNALLVRRPPANDVWLQGNILMRTEGFLDRLDLEPGDRRQSSFRTGTPQRGKRDST